MNPSCDIFYAGDCFKYVNRTYSWVDAEANCVTLGGHLASVNNEFENTVIRALDMSSKMWIGLRVDGQNISWSDNLPVSYAKWAVGYPDSLNANLTEQCVAYSINFSSSWYGRMCILLYKSVCRISLCEFVICYFIIANCGISKESSKSTSI